MGQQVRKGKIADSRRRKQREAATKHERTLFDKDVALDQTYTVTVAEGRVLKSGDPLFANLGRGAEGARFSVSDTDGRRVGTIAGESARVLAEALLQNKTAIIPLAVIQVMPLTGDVHARIRMEPTP